MPLSRVQRLKRMRSLTSAHQTERDERARLSIVVMSAYYLQPTICVIAETNLHILRVWNLNLSRDGQRAILALTVAPLLIFQMLVHISRYETSIAEARRNAQTPHPCDVSAHGDSGTYGVHPRQRDVKVSVMIVNGAVRRQGAVEGNINFLPLFHGLDHMTITPFISVAS